jgi:hypothetical protein
MGNLVLNGATSGATTLTPTDAVTTTVTFPSLGGTAMVSGNMPAFLVWKSSSIGNTTVPNGVSTKITYDTKTFDTNNNFASSRFTPTVAGYYVFTSSLGWNTASATTFDMYIAKNGSLSFPDIRYYNAITTAVIMQGTYMYYMNGTTDYVETYAYQGSGGSIDVIYGQDRTWFMGYMVRAA